MVDYTNAAGYVVDAKGRRQFQDRDKANGIDGTSLIADDLNQDRNALVDLVAAAGMTPDASDETQVTQAVQYFGKKAASGMVSGSPGVLASGDVAGAILYYSGAGGAPAFIYGNQTVFLLTNSALNGYATQAWIQAKFLALGGNPQTSSSPTTFNNGLSANTLSALSGQDLKIISNIRMGSLIAYLNNIQSDGCTERTIAGNTSVSDQWDFVKRPTVGGGAVALQSDVATALRVPGANSPWVQMTPASFNASDGQNGTLITLGTAYPNKCLFAWGNDVGPGAHSFGTTVVDAGHVRIFGKVADRFTNSTINLMTIGY